MNSDLRPTVSAANVKAIGFDIGGTKIAFGVIDALGNVVTEQQSHRTPHDPAETVGTIREIVSDMRRRHADVAAIGVGAAGLVDWPEGRIRWAPNNSYRDIPLRMLLEDGCGLPTVVDNDANAAAWAEYRLSGDGDHLLFLTIGTGVGGGLILGGQVYRGSSGIAAEVGHMIIDVRSEERCGCGNFGCLEAMASGTAIGRYGRAAALMDPHGQIASFANGTDGVSGETVYLAAAEGDAAAQAIYERVGAALGLAMASLVTVLDVDRIVIGGGASVAGDLLLRPARTSMMAHLFARDHRVPPSVRLARHGTGAGWMGAGLLALDRAGADSSRKLSQSATNQGAT